MKLNRKNLFLAATTAITVAFAPQSASAQALFWDANNNTAGFASGAGTWAAPTLGTLTSGWSTSGAGTAVVNGNSVTTTLANSVNFGADTAGNGYGGGTITVSGTVDALSIKAGNQNSGALVLSGGIINLAATATITNGSSTQNVTINSQITGAATSLTKAGPGNLVLGFNNSYTGSTLISGGALILNNATALGGNNPGTNGTSSISMANGTTLQSNYAPADMGATDSFVYAPITLTGATANFLIGAGSSTSPAESVTFNLNGAIGGISSTGVVFGNTTASRNNADSIIVLGAAATYTGNTTIQAGNTANKINVKAGVENALPITTVLSFDAVAGSGSGRTTQFDLNGNNQKLAGLDNGGTVASLRNIRVTNTGALAVLTIENAISTSHVFGGANGSQNAQITGAIALTKAGAGTFTLAAGAGNAFTGDTKILGGILSLGHATSIQNSAFDTAGSIAGDASNGLRTTVATLTMGGLTGNKNFADVFTTALGGTGGTTTRGGYDGLTALTLNPGTGVTNSYSGDIGNGAGAMTLTKSGLGTQILTVAQTYSGGTLVSNGTLALSGTGTLGASGTALTLSGGSLDLGTLSQTVGAVSVTAAAASGDTISNGSLTGTSYAASNATGTAIISANLLANGAAGFDKSGAGTTTLSGTNTYTGTTTITAGVLGTALPDNLAGYTTSGKVVFNGGRLNIATGDGTTNGWSAAQVSTLLSNATKTSGVLGITVDNGDVTETAFDFGGLALVKSGANTLTLTQAHSSLASTTIASGGGTLKITDAGALGAGNVSNLAAGANTGTLELALTGTNNITNTFSGFNSAFALTNATPGSAQILNTSGNNTIASDLTVTNTGGNGLNVVSNGGLLTLIGTISHTIATGRTMSLGGSGDGVISGPINNNSTGNVALSLIKSGDGTWTLSNSTSTYTGATTVTAGTLLINGNSSTATGTVAVNGGTLGGTGTISGTVSVAAGATLSPGATIESLVTGAVTMASTSTFAYGVTGSGATGADLLAVNGALSLTDVTLDLALANAVLSGGGWMLGDKLTLMSYIDATSGLTSGFTGYADDTGYTFGSNVWTLDYNDTTAGGNFTADLTGTAGVDAKYVTMTYSPIPEPNVAALLGALGGILLLRRRR